MILFKHIHIILLLAILSIISPCIASLFGHPQYRNSVWDILTSDSRFSKLLSQIEAADLKTALQNSKAKTLFAPVNEAFDHENSLSLKRKISKEQLLYHLVNISVKSDELWDGRLLDTASHVDELPQRLRVSKSYTEISVGTGGDQPQSKVTEQDIEASDGIIHTIDRILSLPVHLDETLRSNKDTRDFFNKAERAEIIEELRKTEGATVFATKGDIFGDALSPTEKAYLLDHPQGRQDLARILKHNISPKIYHSDRMAKGKSTIPTVEGSEHLEIYTEVNKLLANKFTVNDINVIRSDIIAANGVIHVLESPLLPKKKNFIKPSVRKTLIGLNRTQIVKLFDENGLGEYLDEDQKEETTILAPPNDALERNGDLFKGDKNIKSWLSYHIIQGNLKSDDLKDGQLLETKSHDNLGKDYQRLDVHISDNPSLDKDTILFRKSAVVGDPVTVGNKQTIYPVSQPLELPRDPLSQLPVNLELSTFVASIYASETDKKIQDSHGITIFAPTNDAFNRLGMLAKHLLQPESKQKLKDIATYHAALGVFYSDALSEGKHRVPTLASDAELWINKTKDGIFVRGEGAADGDDREVIGQVDKKDILTSNGVIHTIDRVQVPSTVKVTINDLLSAEGTTSLLHLIQRANLEEKVLEGLDPKKPYTVLAPSDRAFGKINLGELLEDHEKLLNVIRLHILPIQLPRLEVDEILKYRQYSTKEEPPKDVPYLGVDIPTLSDDRYVVIRKGVSGGYDVSVKGTLQDRATIINFGRATNNGGVLMIDNVLLPKEDYNSHKMPWWAIILIIVGAIVGLTILAGAMYAGWRWYKSRREGNINLGRDN